MATEQQQPQQTQKSISARTVILIVIAVILTIFTVKNWVDVVVWPLGPSKMSIVIAISFVLGGLIGWLAHSIATGRPSRRD